jgi:hypothetical protein
MPHPEEPVGGEEPKLTRALPPQDGHQVSQGDELKLQTRLRTRNESAGKRGRNCDRAHNGMAVARKSLDFSTFRSFEKHRIHGLDVFLSYARSDVPHAGIGQLGLEIALQFLSIPLIDEREVPSNDPNSRNSIAT